MRGQIESENKYLALETSGGLFAIPICETRGVVIGTQAMRPAVVPQMADYVKCVAMVGGLLTTIITLPGDRPDVQPLGKPIVILAHPKRTLGVIANSVKLVTIPDESIAVDQVTGTKTYTENSDIFSIVDIKDLFGDRENGV